MTWFSADDGVGNDGCRSLDVGDHDPDPTMAEIDEVLRCLPCSRPVVDVDARDANGGLPIDVHQRHLATLQPIDRDGVAVARVHERAIHRNVACRQHVTMLAGREQGECQSCGRQLVGDGAEERRGHLVGEGVAQRLGQQHSDRTGGTACQRSCRRVGPGVAELLGGGENSAAQIGRQLVRSRERIRHSHATDPDPISDRLQRHSRHPMILLGIGGET